MASEYYLQGYDASVIIDKDYIKQAQDTNVELNISGFGTGAGDSSGKVTLNGNIEDKY